jgi:hypothetical protein
LANGVLIARSLFICREILWNCDGDDTFWSANCLGGKLAVFSLVHGVEYGVAGLA